MTRSTRIRAAAVATVAFVFTLSLTTATAPSTAHQEVIPNQTPLDLVDALHAAFGEHHDRAVHTKGVMFEGTFTPSSEARGLTTAPIFAGPTLPIVARFSLFAGIPDLPGTDAAAAPTGLAIKIKAADSTDYDLVSDQHNGFVVATSDEFAAFLRAAGASGAGAPPTSLERFLATRPIAQHFFATLTSPASYATATFFGINSFKWTNTRGQSVFVRYKYVPRAGEQYLTPTELKAKGPNYLQDEIVSRVAQEPVVFDWYAQIAEQGDKIEDPSIAWPDSRRFVKLGTFTLTKRPADLAAANKQTFFLVGQPHPGIEPADPMLILRNTAYPISVGQRQ